MNFSKCFCRCSAVLAAGLVFFNAQADITAQEQGNSIVIEREGRRANPTIRFQGINGDPALNTQIDSDLRHCGWFDVRKGGNETTDYVLSGSDNGNTLMLSLSNGAGRKIADLRITEPDKRKRSAKGVDAVLKKEFSVPGICSSKVIFSAETGPKKREIYMCDFDGGNITRLTRNNSLSVEPVWTRDGRSFVYCYYGNAYTNLIQYRFDIAKSRPLTRYNGLNAGGTLSYDGKYVALVLSRNNQVDLYVRPTEGGDLVRLTYDKAAESSPVWTPDNRIIYVSGSTGVPNLYSISPFGDKTSVRLRNLRGSERVKPDVEGNNLVYAARVGGSYLITVAEMQNNSFQMKKIGFGDSPEIVGESPSWAPDGRHVVYCNGGTLYIVDTWLGKTRRLVGGRSKVFQPDWSPVLH